MRGLEKNNMKRGDMKQKDGHPDSMKATAQRADALKTYIVLLSFSINLYFRVQEEKNHAYLHYSTP